MARTSRFLVLSCLLLSAAVVLGCENDETPKPEAVAAKPPTVAKAAAAAPAQPAAGDPAGACGMAGETPKAQAGGGCGDHAQVKAAEAPSGCGCGAHDTGSADKPVVPITEAKLGDRTRCPVTNSVFVVKTDSPKAEHDGKTYHFCCEGCVSRFKKDPKQFLES